MDNTNENLLLFPKSKKKQRAWKLDPSYPIPIRAIFISISRLYCLIPGYLPHISFLLGSHSFAHQSVICECAFTVDVLFRLGRLHSSLRKLVFVSFAFFIFFTIPFFYCQKTSQNQPTIKAEKYCIYHSDVEFSNGINRKVSINFL